MNELKPEDLMRALECCERRDCERCHYKQRCGDACVLYLCGDALALLREKDAEIERLTEERDKAQAICVQMGKLNQAEIAKARTETLTEFAEVTVEWCQKKLKFDKYQTIGLSGKRLEGYEAAMKSMMSYMHSLKEQNR